MGANVISVSLKDLPGVLDRTDKLAFEAVKYGARAGAQRGRSHIVRKTPRDQGQLAASWKVNRGSGDVLAELINDAPHISIVELGARPHKVSREGWLAIYEWVRRHFRGGELGGGGSMRPRRDGSVDPAIASITWGIVKKIEKVGQKPTFFVLNELPTLRELMAAELDLAFARLAARGGKK